MFESIHHYFAYHYPGFPGGEATAAVIFLILCSLLWLYRTTRWGGWMAFFLCFAFYTMPLMAEFHRH
jgi:hypothetical protein